MIVCSGFRQSADALLLKNPAASATDTARISTILSTHHARSNFALSCCQFIPAVRTLMFCFGRWRAEISALPCAQSSFMFNCENVLLWADRILSSPIWDSCWNMLLSAAPKENRKQLCLIRVPKSFIRSASWQRSNNRFTKRYPSLSGSYCLSVRWGSSRAFKLR